MKIGTAGFVGGRLVEAREGRGLTTTSLAELLGVSTTAISQYEHDKQTPRPDIMDAIADKLNFPRSFFLRPVYPDRNDTIFYRSMSSATKMARMKSSHRFRWLKEIVSYLRDSLDLPTLNLPAFRLPQNILDLTIRQIEELAADCRQFWGLGDGPIPDLVLILENNGVIVTRGRLDAETLDAFSQWSVIDGTPYVFLSSDKASAVRSRLDAAHELSHLLFHRHVTRRQISSAAVHKQIEAQAFRFASAFLLPATSFTRELWAPTLDAFISLKERWKTSVGVMIRRCEELDIIDEQETRRMWINYNRRGYKKVEPLDDRLPVESPRLLRRSFDLLIEAGVKTREQILLDLPFAPTDIEELAGLPRGYLSGLYGDAAAMPRLRDETIAQTGTGVLLPFSKPKAIE
jgi:Zn-dependent peptidase ImmA (M78 family)/DNA-binding XRE family transcriptional regulator